MKYSKKKFNQRRGSVLLLILAVSMILTVIGMSALFVNRVHNRTTQLTHGFARAQTLAVSAMEQALQVLNRDIQTEIDEGRDWRLLYAHDAVVTTFNLGEGSCSWKLRDDIDHDLNDDNTDNFWIYATGLSDDIAFTLRIEMTPTVSTSSMSCLEVAVLGGTNVHFFNNCNVVTNQIIASNGNITANRAEVHSATESHTTTAGSSYNGSASTGVEKRTFPTDEDLNVYLTEGTAIAWDSLTVDGSNRILEEVILSPTSNPFGDPNPNGVYVIDCGSDALTIRNCRILGTLYVQNDSESLTLSNAVNWEPAVAEYPALISTGTINIEITEDALSEEAIGKNLNPGGSPYAGNADTDQTDSYPSQLQGIFFAVDDLNFTGTSTVRIYGCLLARFMICFDMNSTAKITRPSSIADVPPPGFGTTTETAPPYPVSSTWEQVVTN